MSAGHERKCVNYIKDFNMPNQENLSKEELEILAQSYLDCKLTRLQEKELEWVFLNSPLSSPLIDECRKAMRVENLLDSPQSSKSAYECPKPAHFRIRPIVYKLSAAASVVLIIACSVILFTRAWLKNDTSSALSDIDVSVYVHGKVLNPNDALSRAIATQQQSMAMLAEIKNQAQNTEINAIQDINEISNAK